MPVALDVIGLPVQKVPNEFMYDPGYSGKIRPDWPKLYDLEVRRTPIRSSSMKTLAQCKRKFMFESRLGLRTAGYDSSLYLGLVWHKFLELVFTGREKPDNLEYVVGKSLREHMDKLIRMADSTGMLPSGKYVSELMKDVEVDTKKALAMAKFFLQCYPPEQLLANYDIVGIEQAYAIKIPTIKVPLVVRLDMLLRDKEDGGYIIVDHKTTSRDPAMRAATIPYEFQPQLYKFVTWCALELERFKTDPNARLSPATRIKGIMHLIMRKPSIRYCRKDSTTADYIARVHQWYLDEAAKNPQNPPVLCSVVPHSGPYMTPKLYSKLVMHNKASTVSTDLDAFWPNDQACWDWNKPCPYMPLCQAEAQGQWKEWDDLLENYYRQEFREDSEAEEREEN